MTSQGYRDWLTAGRPYTLIRPAQALQSALRGHGLTVYDRPNDAHLQAPTPEDHTPFSVTGFPGKNARWRARGLDVMPRGDSKADRAENAAIARQLIRDRDAGVPAVMWIKFINWTDEDGVCRQERWMDPGAPLRRTTRTSTDRGHIHISGRSDVDDDTRADGYDPLTERDDDMDLDDSGPKAILPGATNRAVLRSMFGILVSMMTGSRRDDLITWGSKDIPDRLWPALAGSAQREQDMLTTLAAVTAGGTDVDTAAVIAAINARSADVTGVLQQQTMRISELEAELEQERHARHAAAQAVVDATADVS